MSTDFIMYKQGAVFFVEDVSTGTSGTIKVSEYTPNKSRPWIVVSNDLCNNTSPSITMCPIFTRDSATYPTQVFYKNGSRNQVIACEQVTAIPKTMIGRYLGTVSPHIWNEVRHALDMQFRDVHVSATNTDTAVSDDTIKNFNNPIDAEIQERINKLIDSQLSTSNTTTHDVIKTDTATESPATAYAKTKHMTLGMSKDFYEDSFTMSLSELQDKYKDYTKVDSVDSISKKRYAIRKRLAKAGIKV